MPAGWGLGKGSLPAMHHSHLLTVSNGAASGGPFLRPAVQRALCCYHGILTTPVNLVVLQVVGLYCVKLDIDSHTRLVHSMCSYSEDTGRVKSSLDYVIPKFQEQ